MKIFMRGAEGLWAVRLKERLLGDARRAVTALDFLRAEREFAAHELGNKSFFIHGRWESPQRPVISLNCLPERAMAKFAEPGRRGPSLR